MSFRAELRAWLRRELIRRARERGGLTAEEIRRLIDYPFIPLSYTAADRPEIPGTVGIGRRIDQIAGELPDTLLEHGMLIYPEASPTYPLEQYNTADLQGYLSGPGSAIPGESLFQYLIGEAVVSAFFCAGGWSRYNYAASGAPYTPSYPSLVFLDGSKFSNLDPDNLEELGNWSGLTRFLVQCRTGSGRNLAELLDPVGWTPDATTDGLIRLWDGDASAFRWWYVRATALAGVQAVELVPTGEGLCPHAWLNAHGAGTLTLDQNDLRMFEAWVMRSFQANTQVLELITPALLAPVWENGAAPVTAGWATAVQELGDPASEALVGQCMTTLYEESLVLDAIHHAKTWEVQYSLVSGAPTAALVQVSGGQAHIENTVAPLWYPKTSGAGLELFHTQVGDPGTSDDYCPVYSFYRPTALVQLEYIKHFATTGESRQFLWDDTYHCVDTSRGWLGICADELGTIWRYGERVRDVSGGGWRVAEITAGTTWGAGGAGRWRETKTFSIVGLHAGRECCSDQFPQAQPSLAELLGNNDQWCGGSANAEAESKCAGKHACNVVNYELRSGDSEIWKYDDSYSAGSWGGKGAIIPRNQREAVYLAEGIHYEQHERSSGVKRRFYPEEEKVPPTCPGEDCGQYNLGHCEFKLLYRITDNPGEDAYFEWGNFHSAGLGSCQGGDDGCGVVTPWELLGTQPIDEDELTVWLIGRHATTPLLADWAAWVPYLTANQGETRAWDPTVVASHFEGAGWHYETPASRIVTGNLPGDPVSDLYVPAGAI